MNKLLALLLLSSISHLTFAADYKSRYDTGYVNERNQPKSYTLSGDRNESSRASISNTYRSTSSDSDDVSKSVNGVTRQGNQINSHGLIINDAD